MTQDFKKGKFTAKLNDQERLHEENDIKGSNEC